MSKYQAAGSRVVTSTGTVGGSTSQAIFTPGPVGAFTMTVQVGGNTITLNRENVQDMLDNMRQFLLNGNLTP
jgi:hypothetical protein